MLSEAELLPTIAEVSVAYAGFASLISVFAGISSREKITANLFRLRGMLETSALTLAFSLVPFLPAKFGASNETSWRMAALAFSVLVIARIAYKISAGGPKLINRRIARAISGVQILASLLLLSTTFWLSLNMVVGAYYLLLFVVLLTSAYLFLRVAMSVLTGTEAES